MGTCSSMARGTVRVRVAALCEGGGGGRTSTRCRHANGMAYAAMRREVVDRSGRVQAQLRVQVWVTGACQHGAGDGYGAWQCDGGRRVWAYARARWQAASIGRQRAIGRSWRGE